MKRKRIFISYSHKDEVWKERVITHLKALQIQVDAWDDTHIKPGDKWYEEIEKAINGAEAAILLISAEFLASDFIQKTEIPKLLQRRDTEGMKIFPLIVRPCAWAQIDWLKSIQTRPTDDQPLSAGSEHRIDSILTDFTVEIKNVLTQTAPVDTVKVDIKGIHKPEKIYLARLPTTDSVLLGREKELQILDKAWEEEHTCILTLVAWGGQGKTALVNEWLNQMQTDNFRGSERVYGWSFYSHSTFGDRKTSAADFIENALKWFGDPKPEQGSQRDKGERLAELVREKKTLLIIDGIEALQYPPGEKQGRLKDPALQELLKELARSQPGLCVITTRLEVADIDQAKNRSAKTIYLKPLPSKVGAELLKELGVKGSVAELKNASEEYKGHAFSLGLLGRYLAVVHKGDIQKKELIPRLMDEEKKGGHGRRMLEFYEQFLSGKVELDILYLMGLFDRPAAERVIKTLCTEHAIEGLTTELKKLSDDQWKYALKHMLDLNLLQTTKKDEKDKDKETLDCHPLLREYFGEKLRIINLEAWKTAHSKLYEYYKSLLEKKYPYTLDTLLSAVIHGSLAGMHTKVWKELYWERFCIKGQYYSTFNSNITVSDTTWDLMTHELIDKTTYSVQKLLLEKILNNAQIEGSKECILCAKGSLSFLEGDLPLARNFFKKSIEIESKFAPSWFEMGEIDFQQKEYDKAEKHFKKAVSIDNRLAPALERLGTILSINGKYKDAEEFLRDSIEIDDKNANAWNSLGSVYYEKKDFTRAMEYYKRSLEIDSTSPIPYGNIAIIYVNQKKFKEAEDYFKKAIAIDDKRSKLWSDLGYLYYEQGNNTEAERCYLRSLQLDENFPHPYFNIGWLLIKEKNYEEARRYFIRALELYKKVKDKRGAREAKYHVKKLTKASNLTAEQKKKQTLSSDMFYGAVKLYFALGCIAAIILAGSILYGFLFGWTSAAIEWRERSLVGMTFIFIAFFLYYLIHRYRDIIPKSLKPLLNSMGWFYFKLLLPWTYLGVGIYTVPKMDLKYSEQLIGYFVVILFTILFFKLSDPLFLFKVIKQPRLKKYTFTKSPIDKDIALKMVHTSDIHATGAKYGITNDGKFFIRSDLKEKFDRIKHMERDVLILTGDITDAGEQSDWDLFCSLTGDLSAKVPVIMVPGNHDIIHSKRLWVDNVGEQVQLKICRFLKQLNPLLTPEFISIRKDTNDLISSRELLDKEMPFLEEYLCKPPVFYGNRDIDVSTKDIGMGVSVEEGEEFRRPQRILEDLYPLALLLKKHFLVVALDSLQHEDSSQFIIENAIGRIHEDQLDRLRQMVTKIEPQCLIIALHHQPGVLRKNTLKSALSLVDSREFLKVCESLNCRLILNGHVHDRHFYQFGNIPIFCSGASITYSKSFPIYTIDKDYNLSKEVIKI